MDYLSAILWITFYCFGLGNGFGISAVTDATHRTDPLALLSATLRTYQTAACESEQVTLSCPHGTGISVELVQYGNDGAGMNLCSRQPEDDTLMLPSGTEIEVKPPESCLWPNAMQYSLLQTASETCQKKRHCKFTASARAFGGDPCPGVKKFVEVAFKCRPYEFRSKVACENDVIQLVCNPYSRIAVYSASYGRTEYESIQCAQPLGVKEETCLVSYATETVMQKCHGRRRCTLSADSATFGKPCHPDSRMYLKVVYTCVPRKVLKDVYDSASEQDEPDQMELDGNMDPDELYDDDQFYRENEAIPPAPKLQGDHSRPRGTFPPTNYTIPASSVPTTVEAPHQQRDENLEVEKLTKFGTASPAKTVVAGAIIVKNAQSSGSSLSARKLSGNKFKRKFIEMKSRGSSSTTTTASHDYDNDVNTTTLAAIAKMPAQPSLHHPAWGTRRDNDSTSTSTANGTTTSCPPCDSVEEGGGRIQTIGFVTEWINAYIFLAKNQEKFYLYLIISVTAGVLICLTLLVLRLLCHHHHRRPSKSDDQDTDVHETSFQKSNTGETTIPNGFSDDISEIDADIDLTATLPISSLTRNDHNYGMYSPAPSPFGVMGGGGGAGTANLSHTSTTMLVPMHSQAGVPHSVILGPVVGAPQMGAYVGPGMGTLPRYGGHMAGPPPTFLTGSIIGPICSNPGPTSNSSMGGGGVLNTLSRQSMLMDGTIPRSLSRGGTTENSQFYYG